MSNIYNHHTNIESEDFLDEQQMQVLDDEVLAMRIKYLKGTTTKTFLQIAQELQTPLSKIKTLWKKLKNSKAYDIEKRVNTEVRFQLMQTELMIMELWEAVQLSKQEQNKKKTEQGETSKGEIFKETTETIDRLVKVEYFSEIRKIMEHRAELLGLKKNLEVNFNQTNTNNYVVDGAANQLVPPTHAVFLSRPADVEEGAFTEIEDDDSDEVLIEDEPFSD